MCSSTECECAALRLYIAIHSIYGLRRFCPLSFFHLLTNRSIFRHVGGLFTGSSDGKYPGLAGLKESGELLDLIKRAKGAKEDLVSSAVEIFQ